MLTIGFDNFYTKLHTTEFVLVWTFIHYFCVSFLFCTVVVTSAIHYANSIYSSVTSGPSYFTSSCSGSESHLLNCNFSTTSYCYRQYLAGVRCYGKYYHRYSCSISGVISVMYTSYHSVNSGCTEGVYILLEGKQQWREGWRCATTRHGGLLAAPPPTGTSMMPLLCVDIYTIPSKL